jgi:aspartyl-tRNA(Asn)/glutamyl-tRNA(Gln) amidotransferase subunit B
MVVDQNDPEEIAKQEGLLQQNDEEGLKIIVKKIIEDNPDVVEEYKGGKESVLQFFVGQGMKETKGSANPQVLGKIAKELLE